MSAYPIKVRLVEVGPRDGLQNEAQILPLEVKLDLITQLAAAGLKTIEATSFVSPHKIPQMADAAALLAQLPPNKDIHYPVLVPNIQGLEAAVAAGAKEISLFTAVSERFCERNIHCTIAESLARFREIMAHKPHDMKVRGYISCVIACPYEGPQAPEKTVVLAEQLLELGCYEVSLGDTIGIGTPGQVAPLLDAVLARIPARQLAIHFHDTYGQALANILLALNNGICTIDSSVGGLGGCPYADGATGNVATEDVVYMLHGMGIETGIDLKKLIDVSWFISRALGREPRSKTAIALAPKA